MYDYTIYYVISWVVGGISLLALAFFLIKNTTFKEIFLRPSVIVSILIIIGAIFFGTYSYKTYSPDFAMPPFMHTMAPGGLAPYLPLKNISKFFERESNFARVNDIGADYNAVPPPITRTTSETVEFSLTATEVISEIAPNIYFNYWTYNKQVPGPMLRVRTGDTVIINLTNDITSLHSHNIDLHAVNGPGGGATLTNVTPGETKSFKWKAVQPGIYVYHCATANVSTHNSHGQYGLILVEPEEGLPKVDKEFYVMQGELYTQGDIGRQGMMVFDAQKLIEGNPTYVTFNGRIEKETGMEINRGEHVRVYVGNGGVNLVSSFHIIGEIFDTVYPEGSMGKDSALFKNIQTTIIPAGGAAIVEFVAEVPGKLVFVDHALARMNKGAWATAIVKGDENPEIFTAIKSTTTTTVSMPGMDHRGY